MNPDMLTAGAVILLALIVPAAVGIYLDARRQRCWADDDIAPPDWTNHGRDDQ